MRVAKILLLLACAVLVTVPVLAQGNPTGSLSGRIMSEGEPLGGVTVSVTSPNLQGTRTTTTTGNGDYIFQFLPPGDYEVTFEMQGFQSVTRSVKINAQQATRLEVPMSLAAVSEEIVVTGTYETISSTPQASTTYTAKVIEELPIARTVAQATILAPGVHDTGPGGNITISGAQSHENLFMVNGVVVNENLRGQPLDLFIEDAVQETTVSTSGISAEFGRFAGGIVNAITRSGGNEFNGTFRSSYTNDDWNGETPLTRTQLDKTVPSYEATLGGPLWKDRIWFFLAGRDRENLVQAFTTTTLIPFEAGADQQRYEGKLTFSLSPQHTFRGTYQEIDQVDVGNRFGNVLDLDSVIDRETPQELKAANYTGILTENLFVEAQWSERKFSFIGSGSRFTDLERGTLLLDRSRANARFHSPTFCGVCDPENRDNENILGKGSYFLSTESLGSHDIIGGYDRFNDRRFSNNHQSGSDYRVLASRAILGDEIFPVFTNDGVTIIQWNPILLGSKGADFQTDSVFLNDKWQLNERWSFNVGVRYDKNDGRDGEGKVIAKDDNISPRLGLSWDVQGDGDWIVNASYGQYVTSISNGVGDATSTGGTPATFQYRYRGPEVNTGAGPFLSSEEALRILFDWYFANFDSLVPILANIPGGNTRIDGSLNSPNAQEYVVGVAKRLGTRGFLRADLVHREFGDFYSSRIDRSTGQVDTPNGRFDLALIGNSNAVERTYDALQTQIAYRVTDKINLGGNYTLSFAEGNFNGETRASGPVTATVEEYPEYKEARWNSPDGYLAIDQRHRARVWGIYNVFNTDHHSLSVSLLQNFFSGSPYAAVGLIDPSPFVTNPGYEIPPDEVDYFFTDRDEFETDDVSRTDISLNYGFKWAVFGRDVEVFLQPEVLNVFNEDGVVGGPNGLNMTVFTASNSGATSCSQAGAGGTPGRCLPFNPFTETPVEGVHWQRGPNFGKPTVDLDFQDPRIVRFSVGFRF